MKSNVSDNLALTVAKAGAIELPAEILEFSIDQALDDGILKDIPFVGWIAKAVSAGMAISDKILYHKILRFVFSIERFAKSDRDQFRSKIEHDPVYRRKVGEHLIIMLDKVDSLEKAHFLAIVFDHCLTGHIEHDCFIDLAHIVSSALLADLKAIGVPDNQRIMFSSTGLAAASGILEYGIAIPEVGKEAPELGTRLSKHGEDLRDMFLGRYRTREEDARKRREIFRKRFEHTPKRELKNG
jgi:hypothetical protein